MFKLDYVHIFFPPSVPVGVLDTSECLTPLGERVACMSCDPRLGKLLVLSSLFRCVLPMLSVAACLTRDPFHNSLQNRSTVNKVTHIHMSSRVCSFNLYVLLGSMGHHHTHTFIDFINMTTLFGLVSELTLANIFKTGV